jgi:Carboxypeptidase regulatory-like domain
MRRLAPALAIAAIAAAGLVWWLMRDPTPAPRPAIVGPASASRPDSAPASLPATRKIVPGGFAKRRAADTGASDSGDVAVMRGRCVDAGGGAALPGCTATLRGNGPASWESPPAVVTGADGSFEIRFEPPPSFAFFLFVEAPGRAKMLGRFSKLKAGTVTDVGDVAMSPGTVVRGRVVDEGGTPQPKISVILAGPDPTPRGRMGPQSHFELVSKSDGSIASEAPLTAGTYRIEVRPPVELVTPQAIDLAQGAEERLLEVKVRGPSDADAIVGGVQDEFGAPVRGADVDYSPRGYKGNTSWSITSDEQGAFRIQRVDQDREKAVTLKASREGYDPPTASVKAKWGTKDVVVVLRRGVAVRVVVRDGNADQPLERYGVRCFRPPGTAPTRENSPRVREQGFHRDGIAEIPRIGRGRHLLLVEPEGEDWRGNAFRQLEVTDSGEPPPPLEVTVWRAVNKTVRVRRKDGSPVLATGVDLLRRLDETPVDESTRAVTSDELFVPYERIAQRVDSGATGSAGTTELSAPPHEKLVLRVLGSGHAPAIKEVDFATDGPIIDVVVTSGATLAGRITPPELIPQLDARDFPDSPLATGGGYTGVRLRKADPLRKPPFLEYPLVPVNGVIGRAQSAAPIEPDGTFRIDGVPAGRWEVHLRYTEQSGLSGSMTSSHVIGTVELVEGEVREQTFDLGYLLKAELEGSVTLDGKPLETGTVSFEGRITQSDGTPARVLKQNRPLGAGGSFAASLWPGEYRPIVQFLREGRPQIMHGAGVIKASAGERLTVAVALQSSVLKLRVLASDGQTPVADLALTVAVPDSEWNRTSQPTDVLGRAEIDGLPALEVPVSVWPKRLATLEARNAEKGLARHDDARIPVKTIRITPPLTEATIVLPMSLGY